MKSLSSIMSNMFLETAGLYVCFCFEKHSIALTQDRKEKHSIALTQDRKEKHSNALTQDRKEAQLCKSITNQSLVWTTAQVSGQLY